MKAIKDILRRMRKVWRYYRFVAHLKHSNDDFDALGRITADNCNKSHSREYDLMTTYEHVLDARHNKPHRIKRLLTGQRSKRLSPRDMLHDLYEGAADAGYIKIHDQKDRYEKLMCLTDKGEQLRSFPFGTIFGILEYWFSSYSKTAFVLFTAFVAFVFALLGDWLKKLFLS